MCMTVERAGLGYWVSACVEEGASGSLIGRAVVTGFTPVLRKMRMRV